MGNLNGVRQAKAYANNAGKLLKFDGNPRKRMSNAIYGNSKKRR